MPQFVLLSGSSFLPPKSTGDEQHHDHRKNDGGFSGKETDVHIVGGSEWVPMVSIEFAHMDGSTIHRLSRELGFLVAKGTDKTHRNIGCGAIAKLVEIF
jgi:hypothetical protein